MRSRSGAARSQWRLAIYMIKPDFSTMNKKELRQYVIQNQDDKEAFYQYCEDEGKG